MHADRTLTGELRFSQAFAATPPTSPQVKVPIPLAEAGALGQVRLARFADYKLVIFQSASCRAASGNISPLRIHDGRDR